MSTVILAIESSCDETSAAVVSNGKVLNNIIATQAIHQKYGGVVPELASRLMKRWRKVERKSMSLMPLPLPAARG
jgi:tRNA A37 threonylcarbamoyltransferase TsaD